MPNFKDVLAADVDSVFFNDTDFAETAVIDGKTVPVIWDDDALNNKSDVYAMGLADGEKLLLIREKDMRRLPLPGEQITIDGEQWYVRHAVSNAGVFEVRVGRNRL